MTNSLNNRLIGFDIAKVLAIFYIVGVYHNLGYIGSYDNHPCVISLVYTTLGVFTFLSAFILSSKYLFSDVKKTLLFYKKRVLRVWPLFVISSLLLLGIHFNSLSSTIKGIIGVSPFWQPAPFTMWYVAMLIGLYLITPFVLNGGVKTQILKAGLVMAVLGLIQLVFRSVVPKTFNYYTIYLIGLILGSNYYEITFNWLKSKKTLLLSIVWLILFIMILITNNNWLKSFSGVLGIIVMLNLSLLISEKLSRNIKFIKMVSYLAYSSFCAYLFHREIMWFILHLYTPSQGYFIFLEILLLGVPLTFLCAYYIQRLYDSFITRVKIKH